MRSVALARLMNGGASRAAAACVARCCRCVACVFRYFDCFGYSRNVLGCSPDRQRERESESECYTEREREEERVRMRKSGKGRVGSCRLILLFCLAGGATGKQFQFGFATGPMGQVRAQQQQQQLEGEEEAQ